MQNFFHLYTVIIYKLTTKKSFTSPTSPIPQFHPASRRNMTKPSHQKLGPRGCHGVSRFPGGSHVIFPNGEVDPWHWLSVLVPWCMVGTVKQKTVLGWLLLRIFKIHMIWMCQLRVQVEGDPKIPPPKKIPTAAVPNCTCTSKITGSYWFCWWQGYILVFVLPDRRFWIARWSSSLFRRHVLWSHLMVAKRRRRCQHLQCFVSFLPIAAMGLVWYSLPPWMVNLN